MEETSEKFIEAFFKPDHMQNELYFCRYLCNLILSLFSSLVGQTKALKMHKSQSHFDKKWAFSLVQSK